MYHQGKILVNWTLAEIRLAELAAPRGATLSQMIFTTAGTRVGPKFSLGTVLVFLLSYFFAVSPAHGIERFTDEKGVIHISNIPSKKDVNSKKLETLPRAPIPNPVQAGESLVLPREHVGAVVSPHIDPGVPTSKIIPGISSTPLSSATPPSPPPTIANDEPSPNAQVKSEKGQKEDEAIPGGHQGEGDGPRAIPETMTPRGSQVLEINIPETEEESNPEITVTTAAYNSIVCTRDPWGVLHITNASTPEPIDRVGLRPDGRTIGKSPETWSQESEEDLLLSISLESRQKQQEGTPRRNLTESDRTMRENPKYIRVYQDYRRIIHIQNIDLEEHFPQTVNT